MKNFEEISLIIKSQCAIPKPPISSILGQRGINIMKFCKDFNEKTKNFKKNCLLPTKIKIFKDKSFILKINSPTTVSLIKNILNLKKGSCKGDKIAVINNDNIREIYKIKKKDLNSYCYNSAKNIILGSAKSMGVKYENKKDI
ncbi:50S ribosomal protein L11 [Candidatus Vidania fulgoroideae]|uniref:Large ribosomal subunit protein uL11 n=1 Tax=Candidatus Vidania fulgoroideorum TaxID=881286 RepID=A0AAX3N8U8_9PROT|nr:50S ribosomal protein L11 [Candidatus Vidania fulgoroideae]WDR79435.1 50S ribosomal protein L11 [Candidatus Vidania fulgoroideae]